MPVDKEYDIDDAFLEQSWQGMRELLDQEMPEEPKSNPGGKPVLTAILVLLFCWTAYLYWPDFNPVEQIPDTLPSIDQTDPVAELIDSDRAGELISLNQTTSNSKMDEMGQENLNLVENYTRVKSSISESTTSNLAVSTERLYESEYLDNKKAESSIENNLSVVHISSIERKEESKVDNGKNSEAAFVRARIKSFAELDSKDFRPEIGDDNSALGPMLIEPVVEKLGFSLGLRLDQIIDRRLRSGISIGLQVEVALNNRFALHSGLNYLKYKKLNPETPSFQYTDQYLNLSPVTNFQYDAIGDGVPVYSAREQSGNAYSVLGLNTLTYLSLPMELVFHVNEKMRVNAGMAFNYLLNASFYNMDSVTENENLIGDGIRRFDIAPTIGFSFRPTKRLGLDLKFKNGIRDLSNNEYFRFQENHTNRYLHLGMSWSVFVVK